MTNRDAVFPAGRQALYEINRYSAAIRSGDLLFVSGQVGSREDGSPFVSTEEGCEGLGVLTQRLGYGLVP